MRDITVSIDLTVCEHDLNTSGSEFLNKPKVLVTIKNNPDTVLSGFDPVLVELSEQIEAKITETFL
jgi:hypothetical protein